MSFYKDFTVPAQLWAKWRGGELVLDVSDIDGDGWKLITRKEYEDKLWCQVNGERHEDAIDAGCFFVGDATETEVVDDLSNWYGGSYKGMEPAIYYGLHEPHGNDGITVLSVLGTGGDPIIALGFGW